jgi:hypothetical protein
LVGEYKWTKYQFRQKYIFIEEKYSKEQIELMKITRNKELSDSLKKYLTIEEYVNANPNLQFKPTV